MHHVAIIGLGCVGKAVEKSCRGHCVLSTFDKYNSDKTNNWDRANEAEICFVCVPTPTINGEQSRAELLSAIGLLMTMDYKGVVCIKSTIIPGTMRMLQGVAPKLRLVHNPEFLSEKTADQDFRDQEVALLSGDYACTYLVGRLFKKILPRLATIKDFKEFEVTEWAKYLHNGVLPVKLSFLNEMRDLIGDQHIYSSAADAAAYFGNVGSLHKVPGPDGKRGWGGMCFIKDTLALARLFRLKKVPAPTLLGAIETNKLVRPGAYSGDEKTGISNTGGIHGS